MGRSAIIDEYCNKAVDKNGYLEKPTMDQAIGPDGLSGGWAADARFEALAAGNPVAPEGAISDHLREHRTGDFGPVLVGAGRRPAAAGAACQVSLAGRGV